MLDRKSIFKAVDLDIQNVPVPEWGGDICIRGLTARERDHFEASIGQSANLENLRARLVVLSICDETGERVFKDSDATELGKKNAMVVNRLFDICRNMSGMSDADVKELEKN
ncbi:phage tail assembly chaperone [SAR92 clade bacterium H921]|jgi:hypothetical protein|nr:phage tail assembly chaperone [SAR92 clade bacterium H921]|tara:strand:+ start:517 stop:852 length:336 start_codon:yes stop_codon:yes gene_type:complete